MALPSETDTQTTNDDKGPSATTTASSNASKSTPNAGTTTAGTAGTSTATETGDLIGRRLFNPLSEFSSYTYKIGLYFLDPVYYNAYAEGDHSAVKNFRLIAQSGGITKGIDAERAPGIDLDFYIDNLEIETLTSASESKDASNSCKFKFQILEPYGFTLSNKLVQAAIGFQKEKVAAKNSKEDTIVSLHEHYFLMISFYGYDKNGKLISGDDYPQADIKRADNQAVFERGWPIVFTSFKFKLDYKTVVYNIECRLVNELVGKGIKRGMVLNNTTVSGETVSDALNGPTGLFALLNKDQAAHLAKGEIEAKTEYSAAFEENSFISEARLVTDADYTKEKSLLAFVEGYADSNVRTEWLNASGNVDKKKREITIPANTPILQAIDLIIFQSTYIRDGMLAVQKEQYEPVIAGDSNDIKEVPHRALAWWNVTPDVRVNPKKDQKRKDYVYSIKYAIRKYEIPYIRSLFHGYTTKYYGPHKRYKYWYTGKNTEIVSYEQDYNLLYFNASSTESQAETNKSDQVPTAPASAQPADPTGKIPGTMELDNSIKSNLYSPKDALHAKIKILGDPDYLMPAISGGYNTLLQTFYGENFTINPNSGQVFIEVDFNQATDYDIDKGLLDINHDIKFWDYSPELSKQVQGIAYMLTKCVSRFNRGKFEQELTTKLPPPDFSTGPETTARTEAAKPVAPERAKKDPSLAKPDDGSYDRAEAARFASIPVPMLPVVRDALPGNNPFMQTFKSTAVTPNDDASRDKPTPTSKPDTPATADRPVTLAEDAIAGKAYYGSPRVLRRQDQQRR